MSMGAGWYPRRLLPRGGADRPALGRALADEIVREATEGVGETGIHHRRDRDRQAVDLAREERVHRAAARAARQTGLAITTHAVQSAVGLDQLDLFEAEGADLSRAVVGHADSNPSFDYHLAIVERGATVEFDFLGMSFTPLERHGEGRIVDSDLRAAGPRVERVLLSQDVCHDSQLKRYGGNGYSHTWPTVPAAAPRGRVSDDEIRTITVDNPGGC